MTVYLAAPYADQRWAALVAQGLQQTADIGCTSRWLTEPSDLSPEWAQHDLDDIDAADVLVAFNAPSWVKDPEKASGGRHVELGYALAKGKPVVLVGIRSNLFHYHPLVRLVTWHDALNLPAVLADVLAEVAA